MKKILLLCALTVSPVFASTSAQIAEEQTYYDYQEQILSGAPKSHFVGIMAEEQKSYIDALEDLLVEDPSNQKAKESLAVLNPLFYDLAEQFRVALLKVQFGLSDSLPPELVEMIRFELLKTTPDQKVLYLVATNQDLLVRSENTELINLAGKHKNYNWSMSSTAPSKTVEDPKVYSDLFYSTPDTTTYRNGAYAKSVKIFQFCRTNRNYPCLQIMKDVNDQAVRLSNGDLWMSPALSSSKYGLPSNNRNGNTPAGVYTIDSVMPSTDQQISYGKFRRMILNFIPTSTNEALLKSLLPTSSHDKVWWRESVVARDIGRNFLRIHGTGHINQDQNSSFFPFIRTSGCIAKRENTYNGVTYKDQRNLLDLVMTSMNLRPVYANEVKIKGILYVINLDDKEAPVTREDLISLGIN